MTHRDRHTETRVQDENRKGRKENDTTTKSPFSCTYTSRKRRENKKVESLTSDTYGGILLRSRSSRGSVQVMITEKKKNRELSREKLNERSREKIREKGGTERREGKRTYERRVGGKIRKSVTTVMGFVKICKDRNKGKQISLFMKTGDCSKNAFGYWSLCPLFNIQFTIFR